MRPCMSQQPAAVPRFSTSLPPEFGIADTISAIASLHDSSPQYLFMHISMHASSPGEQQGLVDIDC